MNYWKHKRGPWWFCGLFFRKVWEDSQGPSGPGFVFIKQQGLVVFFFLSSSPWVTHPLMLFSHSFLSLPEWASIEHCMNEGVGEVGRKKSLIASPALYVFCNKPHCFNNSCIKTHYLEKLNEDLLRFQKPWKSFRKYRNGSGQNWVKQSYLNKRDSTLLRNFLGENSLAKGVDKFWNSSVLMRSHLMRVTGRKFWMKIHMKGRGIKN